MLKEMRDAILKRAFVPRARVHKNSDTRVVNLSLLRHDS